MKNNNKKISITKWYHPYQWLLCLSFLTLTGCFELDNPDYQETSADHIVVTGILDDAPGNPLFALSDRFPNQQYPVSVNADKRFTVTVPLAWGSNRISHSEAYFPFTYSDDYITVMRKDSTVPQINIMTSNNQFTLDQFIVVTGTVSDPDSGVRRIYAKSDRIPFLTMPGEINQQGQFGVFYPLLYGETNLTITAVDWSGNETSAAFTITRQKAILIDIPVYSETENVTAAITGTIKTYGFNRVTQLTLRSSQLQGSTFIATINGNRFHADIPLQFGSNQITLTAKSFWGTTIETRTIEIKRVDISPPILTVNNPATQTLKAGQISVTGTVQDNLNGQGLQSVTISSSQLNTPIQAGINAGTFSAMVELKAGINLLSIIATDNAGNSSAPIVITVIRPDQDNDGIPDDIDPDRDGDGVNNDIEIAAGTDPDDASDYPDIVAPLLNINNPSQQTVETSSIVITGQLSDPVQPNSGIQSFLIQNDRYPDTQYNAFVNNGQFSVEIPLQFAANRLSFIAMDHSGNQVSVVREVERIMKPRFVHISPADGSVITTNSVTISGEIHAYLSQWQADTETLNDLRFYINDAQITPTGTDEAGRFTFSLPNIALNIGSNTFNLTINSPDGGSTQTLQLTYQPEDPETIAAPVIELLAPVDGSQLNEESFLLVARVTSSGGPLTITLNGSSVKIPPHSSLDVHLSEPVSFVADEDSLSINIFATDSLGKQSQLQANYRIDRGAPQIIINNALDTVPEINPVIESPYHISGRVIDPHLASFLVNGQPVELIPTQTIGSYDFDFAVPVPAGIEVSVQLQAADLSGNLRELNYTLQSTSQTHIEAILPAEQAIFIAQVQPIELQVAARVSELNGAQVEVQLRQNNITLNSSPLSVHSDFATGMLQLPATAGEYTLRYEIQDNGSAIASTQRIIHIKTTENETLALIRIEPGNLSQNIEPNDKLELYFNQSIDLSLLSISVQETLHGKTWLNNDAPGMDFIHAKGAQLQTVHRSFQTVPGTLSLLPGDKTAAFYPQRQFGFNADIQVQVNYDGTELGRSRFKIRPLPTFIIGHITDIAGQPLSGINVSLDELGLSTLTNEEGGFTFGFGEPQTEGAVLSGGIYHLQINSQDADNHRHNVHYGVQRQRINLQQARKNELLPIHLANLSGDIAWQAVHSGQSAILAGGDLQLDLSNATVLFNNSRTSGDLHVQFVDYNQILSSHTPGLVPLWLYAVQPRGLEVEGTMGVQITMPRFSGSYDYLPPDTEYVILLAYQAEQEVIQAIGIGEVNQHIVTSISPLPYRSLDYIGYAVVLHEQQALLKAVAEGKLSLIEAVAELQSSNEGEQ